MWIILKTYSFKNVNFTGNNFEVTIPEGHPEAFCPVFSDKEDAIKWNDNSEFGIFEIQPVDSIKK
jgi:hypothetical protein